MLLHTDKLGKVAITIEEDYWSNDKDYDKLTIVEKEGLFGTFISRKPVPAGTPLTDRKFWIPFSSLKEEIVVAFNNLVSDLNETKENIDEKEANLYTAIRSVIAGGVALKQEFGDDEEYGISQKVLTEFKEDIEEDISNINDIIGEDETEGTLKGRIGTLEQSDVIINQRITTEANRAQVAEAAIINGYEGQVRSTVIVGTLPQSGAANTIYRVPGDSSYKDYAWNGASFVELAEYDNAIDDEPTPNSNNLVKSGGVFNVLAPYFGGVVSLTPIATKSGKIYHGYSSGGSGKKDRGWYDTLSGYTLYIFNVSELVGKSLDIKGYFNTNGYRWVLCKDYTTLPENESAFNEDTTLWSNNVIDAQTGYGGTTGAFTKTLEIPQEAVHLIIQTRNNYEYYVKNTLQGIIDNKQDKLTFDAIPTAESTNPVTSGGVKEYVDDSMEVVEELQEDINDVKEQIDNYDGTLTPIATKNYGLVCNGSSNEPSYWGYSSDTMVSNIYDVTEDVGKTIKIEAYRRANGRPYCFVSEYSGITTTKPSAEDWNAIFIAGTRSNPNSGSSETQKITIASIPEPKTEGGNVYLIVAGRTSYNIVPKATVPANVKIGIPKKTSELENDAGFASVDDIKNLFKINASTDAWVISERDRIINLIKNKINNEVVVFGFNTDQHITKNQTYFANQTLPVLRGLVALKEIASEIPFSVICLGGDAPGYNSIDETQESVTEEVLQVINAVDNYRCPVIAIAGNHDGYQNQGDANADGYTMFNTTIKRNVVRRQLDNFHGRSTNCWFDDYANKIRFVFLDDWSRTGGPGGGNGKRFSVFSSMLQNALSDTKLENSDWGVIIFSHNVIPKEVPGNSYDAASYNGSDINYWDLYVKPRINAGVKVIACFNGHQHSVGQGVIDGVNLIRTHTANTYSISTSFDGITYAHVVGTSTETSFDVFVLDKTAKKIYAYQYGAGADRVFYYGTEGTGPRIMLDVLSGTITKDSQPVSGTVTITHHNTKYTCIIDENGGYIFNYLCPECDWDITVIDGENNSYSLPAYTALEGQHTLDIELDDIVPITND